MCLHIASLLFPCLFWTLMYLYSVAMFRIGTIADLLTKDAIWSGHHFTHRSCSETQNAKNERKMFDILRIITQNNGGQEAETICALAGESGSLFLGSYWEAIPKGPYRCSTQDNTNNSYKHRDETNSGINHCSSVELTEAGYLRFTNSQPYVST